MPIRVKTGTSTWSVIKKVYAKVNTSSTGWKAATKVFAKLPTGWVQVWPGDAPAPSLTDPIDIRTGGYNGSRATSPQQRQRTLLLVLVMMEQLQAHNQLL